MFTSVVSFSQLPLWVAFILMTGSGFYLLDYADGAARDIIRKHHLEDIELSLYTTRGHYGTYPPYGQNSWCGFLNSPDSAPVQTQIETALRQRIDKYANPNKPFPQDPLLADQASPEALAKGDRQPGYFYWKRSPAIFELYASLENDNNNERSTAGCPGVPLIHFDYGLNSVWRETS